MRYNESHALDDLLGIFGLTSEEFNAPPPPEHKQAARDADDDLYDKLIECLEQWRLYGDVKELRKARFFLDRLTRE